MSDCQRWREGRDSYRSRGEPFRTQEYDVALIEGKGSDTTAKMFVCTHHYARKFPATRRRFGLYRRGELVGVAVFSDLWEQVKNTVFPSVTRLLVMELTRFVLLDEVPANYETWFLARCRDVLKAEGFLALLSYSDPVPRFRLDGTRVMPGHVGTIYQASNATYVGRGAADTIWLLPDATCVHNRAWGKIRAQQRGWRSAHDDLVAVGADPIPDGADRAFRTAWVDHWRAQLCRSIQHPGNHKYVWRLNRRVALPPGAQYPKRQEAA
jgi:hypothetical protein